MNKNKLITLILSCFVGVSTAISLEKGVQAKDIEINSMKTESNSEKTNETQIKKTSNTSNSQYKLETGWIKKVVNGIEKWQYTYSDGKRCFGWYQEDGNWYYFDSYGYMVKDQKREIDKKMYWFDSDGHLISDEEGAKNINKTGWVKDGYYVDERGGEHGTYRYVEANGENHIGWLEDNGQWYFFEKCGHMASNILRKIDGKIYSFASDGHLEKNLNKRRGYTENMFSRTGPLDGSGLLCATTDVTITSDGNGVCTLKDDYYSDTNIILCGKSIHTSGENSSHSLLFDRDGNQVFGWYEEPIYTWIGPNVSEGYFDCSKRWTYYDENGVQAISTTKVIDGKSYTFDKDGYLV